MKMGSTTARGYGWRHQQARKRWASAVEFGDVPCARCGGLIVPGEHWDLDHAPGKQSYLGPSHRYCNRANGGRAKRRRRHTVRYVWL